MHYKILPVVKVIIHWKDNEEEEAERYSQWLQDKRIYPATRGGNGGSLLKNSYHYTLDDAKQIECYLSNVGKKSGILPS
jgi:hypothetical protein